MLLEDKFFPIVRMRTTQNTDVRTILAMDSVSA